MSIPTGFITIGPGGVEIGLVNGVLSIKPPGYTQFEPVPLGGKIVVDDGAGGLFEAADFTKDSIALNAPITVNGAAAVMAFSAVVDLTVQGQTTLVPAVAGKQFVPSFLSIVGCANKITGGTVSSAPNITVGDASTFDNLLTGAQGTGFPGTATFNNGAGAMTRALGGTSIVGHPGNPVVVKVATAATGASLVWTVSFTVTGFYL